MQVALFSASPLGRGVFAQTRSHSCLSPCPTTTVSLFAAFPELRCRATSGAAASWARI